MILFIETEQDVEYLMKEFNCTRDQLWDIVGVICIDKRIHEVCLSMYNIFYLPE